MAEERANGQLKGLVISDDDETVDTISSAIEISWPHCILSYATSEEKGMALAGSETPAFIVLDLALNDSGIFKTAGKLSRLNNSALIVLSRSTHNESELIESLDNGADEYISKPIRQMEFLARLRNSIQRKQTEVTKGAKA